MESQPKQAAQPMTDNARSQLIDTLATEIFSARQVTSDNLSCIMPIPTNRTDDGRIITLAVERVLLDNYAIPLDRTSRGVLKTGSPVKFDSPSANELPPRTVKINISPPTPSIKITGVPPTDGRDGYTELSFDWRKRAGAINKSGAINWKDINSVPSVHQDALLATIYDRTQGTPGVDCLGRAVKQKPGKRHQIRWNKKNIYRSEPVADEKFFRLYSRSSGAVEFHLQNQDDPGTLEKIDITATFTIQGDINYDYGDLKSAASLEIKGSIKGNFSLHSEGFVTVTDSIEGQNVDADNITASLITNGCKVRARNCIITNNINNGSATARSVTIKNNASNALLAGEQEVVLPDGATLMAVLCKSPLVRIHDIRLAGTNTICLGEDLFRDYDRLLEKIAEISIDTGAVTSKIKQAAMTILTILAQVDELTAREAAESPVKRLITDIKTATATTIKTTGTMGKGLIENCYELERALERAHYNESLARRVDAMIHQMEGYNSIQTDYSQQFEKLKGEKQAAADLAEIIKGQLQVTVQTGITPIGQAASLKINCGNAGLELDQDSLPQGPFAVNYRLPDPFEDIREGELILTGQGE